MESPKEKPIDVDLSTSNTLCRILIVSSSLEHARTLISRIQALSTNPTPMSTNDSQKQDLLSPELIKIPWTIENKYYSADVHFAAHPMRGLAPYLLQNVPAIIFVWGSNEAYKHHIERVSSDLGEHEPEVLLAVRVKPALDASPSEDTDEEEGGEDNAATDAFVSSCGFEFIDATQDLPDQRGGKQDEEEREFDGIPGLPRVLDALSTIMWPSMKAQQGSKYGRARIQRDPSLFEWGTETRDNSSSLVDDLVAQSGSQLSARAKRIQNEVEELTRWLEQDAHVGDPDDPWKMATGTPTVTASPTDVSGFHDRIPSAPREEGSGQATSSTDLPGFDDDFTVFVSAPADEAEGLRGTSGPKTPRWEDTMEQDGLKPLGGLSSYNSLGSVSDFGEGDGSKKMPDVTSDDEGEDLPTREEIREASSRIFGKKDTPRVPHASTKIQDGEPYPKSTGADFEGDDMYDTPPFDLSRVLGALQQMKEEVSGIENEDERRRAAARVALGLVYGLEAEDDLS